jgi:gamma-glutamylcysteine synthetase
MELALFWFCRANYQRNYLARSQNGEAFTGQNAHACVEYPDIRRRQFTPSSAEIARTYRTPCMVNSAATFFHVFMFINNERLDAFQSAVLPSPTSCLKNDNTKRLARIKITHPDHFN